VLRQLLLECTGVVINADTALALLLHSIAAPVASPLVPRVNVVLYSFFMWPLSLLSRLHCGDHNVDAIATADLFPITVSSCFLAQPLRIAVSPMLCHQHCHRRLIATFDTAPPHHLCADATSSYLDVHITVLIVPIARGVVAHSHLTILWVVTTK